MVSVGLLRGHFWGLLLQIAADPFTRAYRIIFRSPGLPFRSPLCADRGKFTRGPLPCVFLRIDGGVIASGPIPGYHPPTSAAHNKLFALVPDPVAGVGAWVVLGPQRIKKKGPAVVACPL